MNAIIRVCVSECNGDHWFVVLFTDLHSSHPAYARWDAHIKTIEEAVSWARIRAARLGWNVIRINTPLDYWEAGKS